MTKREARVERLKQIIEYASGTQKLKVQATIECGGYLLNVKNSFFHRSLI